MEYKTVIQVIKDTLSDFFSTNFEEAELSDRHYDFSSKDYDFSFPSTMATGATEQTLRKKVKRFLTRNTTLIEKNTHYLFDATGEIRKN